MENGKQYVLSLIACALCCGILSRLVSDTRAKKLMHLVGGMALAFSIFDPLSGLKPESLLPIPDLDLKLSDFYIAEGEQFAQDARKESISSGCEAYILDIAKSLGAEIRVHITLNEELVPAFAQICSNAGPDLQMQLQAILTEDLGIAKENQIWIWNQEDSSS